MQLNILHYINNLYIYKNMADSSTTGMLNPIYKIMNNQSSNLNMGTSWVNNQMMMQNSMGMNNPMNNQMMGQNPMNQNMGNMGMNQDMMNNQMMSQVSQNQNMGNMGMNNQNMMNMSMNNQNMMNMPMNNQNMMNQMNPNMMGMMNQMNQNMMGMMNQMSQNMMMNQMMQMQQMMANANNAQNQGNTSNTDTSNTYGGKTVIFRVSGEDKDPISVQCTDDDKISEVIEKYRAKSGDRDQTKRFIFNAKELNKSLKVSEAGLQDKANIFVVTTQGVKGA